MMVRLVVLFVLLAQPAGAASLSRAYREWRSGPAGHVMTETEKVEWKKLRADEEADEFIRLFWARRDPSPGTPANEYRMNFERLVSLADQEFSTPTIRGWATDRGKFFILVGPPANYVAGAPEQLRQPVRNVELWIYRGEFIPAFLDLEELEVRFQRDRRSNWRLSRAYTVGRSTLSLEIEELFQRARAATLVDPDLRKLPEWASKVPSLDPLQ